MPEINFMIGGEAGQGVQSLGLLLAKSLARGGYHVFADQDVESRVRGGHNFFRIRAKEISVGAVAEPINILLALNKETINLHRHEVAPGGVILFDSETSEEVTTDNNLFGLPLGKLAEERAGNRIMANTVALGAALRLVDYDLSIVEKVLNDYFGTDGKGELNFSAAQAGYDYVKHNFQGNFQLLLRPITNSRRMLINGAEAIALGAIAAGCKFMAAYPMTPTTPILEYLATKAKDYDLIVVQPEDEIAAINMAIGASFAGLRAMTATSGSGFCLMVEGLGLAGVTETPLVVILGQRPGPAVGLPTRTEQGDLQFVLTAHQGDFPRAVLAPADVADSFWETVRAFNLAEKYQIPVVLLTDHYLSTVYTTVDSFDLSKVLIERGELWHGGAAEAAEYKRHQVTPSGVSPRAFPGLSQALVVTDADEHDETGHLTESAVERTAQMTKRLSKLVPLGQEMTPPRLYGSRDAPITFLGWGSTYGAISETVDKLRGQGLDVNMLHFHELWPFPGTAAQEALRSTKQLIAVENNATGQLGRLLRAETGRALDGKILRFDGRPITPKYIIDCFLKEHGRGIPSK